MSCTCPAYFTHDSQSVALGRSRTKLQINQLGTFHTIDLSSIFFFCVSFFLPNIMGTPNPSKSLRVSVTSRPPVFRLSVRCLEIFHYDSHRISLRLAVIFQEILIWNEDIVTPTLTGKLARRIAKPTKEAGILLYPRRELRFLNITRVTASCPPRNFADRGSEGIRQSVLTRS